MWRVFNQITSAVSNLSISSGRGGRNVPSNPGLDRWVAEGCPNERREEAAKPIRKAESNPTARHRIDIKQHALRTLPAALFDLGGMERLNVSENQLQAIPDAMEGLKNLKKLDVSFNLIPNIPPAMGGAVNLTSLNAHRNEIRFIHPDMSKLRQLKKLVLSSNKMREFPAAISDLPKLEELSLADNFIRDLPALEKMQDLKVLDVSRNPLYRILEESKLPLRLETLRLAETRLEDIDASDALPEHLSELKQLKILDVSKNPLLKRLPVGFDAFDRPTVTEVTTSASADRKVRLTVKHEGTQVLDGLIARMPAGSASVVAAVRKSRASENSRAPVGGVRSSQGWISGTATASQPSGAAATPPHPANPYGMQGFNFPYPQGMPPVQTANFNPAMQMQTQMPVTVQMPPQFNQFAPAGGGGQGMPVSAMGMQGTVNTASTSGTAGQRDLPDPRMSAEMPARQWEPGNGAPGGPPILRPDSQPLSRGGTLPPQPMPGADGTAGTSNVQTPVMQNFTPPPQPLVNNGANPHVPMPGGPGMYGAANANMAGMMGPMQGMQGPMPGAWMPNHGAGQANYNYPSAGPFMGGAQPQQFSPYGNFMQPPPHMPYGAAGSFQQPGWGGAFPPLPAWGPTANPSQPPAGAAYEGQFFDVLQRQNHEFARDTQARVLCNTVPPLIPEAAVAAEVNKIKNEEINMSRMYMRDLHTTQSEIERRLVGELGRGLYRQDLVNKIAIEKAPQLQRQNADARSLSIAYQAYLMKKLLMPGPIRQIEWHLSNKTLRADIFDGIIPKSAVFTEVDNVYRQVMLEETSDLDGRKFMAFLEGQQFWKDWRKEIDPQRQGTLYGAL